MSVWQNFKDTDHIFEKKFFGIIILMAIGICIFYLIDKAFGNIPDAKRLLFNNGKLFLYFIIGLIVITIITTFIYFRTLDFDDSETTTTKKALIISVVIWTFYWATWSIFCAWLTLTNKPLTPLAQSIIVGLVSIPGLIAFIISRLIRRDQIKNEEESKLALGDNYSNADPDTCYLDKRYYSGYYGLICLPVYLASLLVGQIL
jgi:hypothetical protein